jgi:hypothetical protein
MERGPFDPLDLDVGFEAIDLAPEGVALDGDIHDFDARPVEAVDFAGEKDCAGARAPNGPSAGADLAKWLLKPIAEDEAGDRGALAAGDDERIKVSKLIGFTDFVGMVAKPLEHLAVLAEVALEGEYANAPGALKFCHRTPLPGGGQGESNCVAVLAFSVDKRGCIPSFVSPV